MNPPMPARSALCILLLSALSMGDAQAQLDSAPSLSISGFGTLQGTFTDRADSVYTSALTQLKGASNRLDVGLESRLGIQAVAHFGPHLSLTGQLLASRVGDQDFGLGMEWLYGQYTVAANTQLRLGRVVLPAFSLSDSRRVSYAQPWLRVPNEVYALMPFTSLDGVQLGWSRNLGAAVLSLQASHGAMAAEVQLPGLGVTTLNAKDVWNLNAGLEWGNWTARLSQTRFRSPVNLPVSPTTMIAYTARDSFTQLGLQFDDGQAIAMAERVMRSQSDVPGLGKPVYRHSAFYVAAGWRFGKFTPLLRLARYEPDALSLTRTLSAASTGASLRYELAPNLAAKLQLDRYDAAASTAFSNPAPTTGQKVNVIGFGIDFVF